MTLNDYFSFFYPFPSVRNYILLEFLCVFFLLISPCIGADKLGFHATFALSTMVALSKYGGILALSAPSRSKLLHTS